MDKINLRIREVRVLKKLQQIEFAKPLGLTQAGFSSLETGRISPSVDHLQKLILHFGVNANWLLTGEGEPFGILEKSNGQKKKDTGVDTGVNTGKFAEVKTKATYLSEPFLQFGTVPMAVTVSPENEPEIVLVEAKARAGYHNILAEPEEYLSERPVIRLPGKKYRNGTFRAWEVYSDSMEPNFHDKDIALTEFVENWPFSLVSGRPYVVCTHDDVVLKRIFRRPGKDNLLHLHSDNKAYEQYTVPVEEVRELWMVIDKITSHLNIESEPIVQRLDSLERQLVQVYRKLGLKGL